MEMIQILHLTDIHTSVEQYPIRLEQKWKKLQEMVLAHKNIVNPLILISGDLTTNGEKEEYALFLDMLEEFLNITSFQKENVVFCPGNHDADQVCENATFHNYEEFLTNFYGKEISQEYEITRRIDEREVRIFSVNTNKRTSLEDPDNAYIEIDFDKGKVLDKEGYHILLMHHKPERILNQEKFSEIAEHMDLILGGHHHPNNLMQTNYKGITSIIGMAITPHTEERTKGAQLLTIDPDNRIFTEELVIEKGN